MKALTTTARRAIALLATLIPVLCFCQNNCDLPAIDEFVKRAKQDQFSQTSLDSIQLYSNCYKVFDAKAKATYWHLLGERYFKTRKDSSSLNLERSLKISRSRNFDSLYVRSLAMYIQVTPFSKIKDSLDVYIPVVIKECKNGSILENGCIVRIVGAGLLLRKAKKNTESTEVFKDGVDNIEKHLPDSINSEKYPNYCKGAAVLHANLGGCFLQVQLPKRAIVHNRKALDYLNLKNDPSESLRSQLLGNILSAANLDQDTLLQKIYIDSIYLTLDKINDPMTFSFLSTYYKNRKQWDSVLINENRYAELALRKGRIEKHYKAMVRVARANIKAGNYRTARSIMDTMPAESFRAASPAARIQFELGNLESHLSKNNPSITLAALDSTIVAINKVEELTKNATINELNEKYEEAERLAEIDKLNTSLGLEKDLSKARLNTALTAASLLFVVCGIGWILYRQKQKTDSINGELEKKSTEISTLNRELNHRTSNQISLAYELILDQRRQIGDEQAKESLGRSESQLMALREVNRALAHRSDDLVRADEVLTKVAEGLQTASPHPFKLDLQLKAITVHGNAASRSALILSELLSNSIKYAFPKTDAPQATITISQNEQETVISYLDNGPGSDGTVQGTGVGSGLIEAMLEDLDAEFEEIKDTNGTGYGLRWYWAV